MTTGAAPAFRLIAWAAGFRNPVVDLAHQEPTLKQRSMAPADADDDARRRLALLSLCKLSSMGHMHPDSVMRASDLPGGRCRLEGDDEEPWITRLGS